MKLAIIDTLGLCYDGSTLSKRGLGGSESAVILMSRELAKIGFDVTVFNDCIHDGGKPGVYDNVMYRPLSEIEKESGYDIVIASRSVAAFAPANIGQNFKSFGRLPNFENFMKSAKHKVLWMHDTFCDGDQFIEPFLLDGRITEVFTLSDFHTSYFGNCDHGNKRMFEVMKNYIFQTRNGIIRYIDWVDITKKDPDLFVYNSSVSKGMIPLVEKIWPRVKAKLPKAKLKIIGGYYKFRDDHGPDEQERKFHELEKLNTQLDVNFTGIIKQSEIAEIMADASFMIYPAAFPETSGISCIEALAHNTPLLTCRFGALEETAIDVACYKIPHAIEPNNLFRFINTDYQVDVFTDMVVRAYNDRYLHQQKMYACNQIKDVCGWDTVALQWKQHFYKMLNLFLPLDDYRKVTHINHRVRKVFGRRFYNSDEAQDPRNPEKNIQVITPVYNSAAYIKNCILSVAQQDYNNYNMHIINDKSTDNTLDVINKTLASLPENIRGKFNVINNETNMGAVYNQINTIRSKVKIASIVMLLDGDDWLVNDPNIFHKYNNIYKDGKAEFTYGSCYSLVDKIPLIAQPYPPEIKKNKEYRKYKFNWNMPYTHLRTFDARLLNNINDSVFKDAEGNWLKAGGDTSVFYNLIEQADPGNVICVPDIVYNYNDINPLNDYKVNAREQTKNANMVMEKTP